MPPLAWRLFAGHSGLLGRCSGTSKWKTAGGSRRVVRWGWGSHYSRAGAVRLLRRGLERGRDGGVGFCSDSTCADSDKNGLSGCCGGIMAIAVADASAVLASLIGDGADVSRPSVSLVDCLDRERHFQKRALALLLLRVASIRRSAQ